jgi:hypothetical protein
LGDDNGWADDFDFDLSPAKASEPAEEKPDEKNGEVQSSSSPEEQVADINDTVAAEADNANVVATADSVTGESATDPKENGESTGSWVDLGNSEEQHETPPPNDIAHSSPELPLSAAAEVDHEVEKMDAHQDAPVVPDLIKESKPESEEKEIEQESLQEHKQEKHEEKSSFSEDIVLLKQHLAIELEAEKKRCADMEAKMQEQERQIKQMAEEKEQSAQREAEFSSELQSLKKEQDESTKREAKLSSELQILTDSVMQKDGDSKQKLVELTDQVVELTNKLEAAEKKAAAAEERLKDAPTEKAFDMDPRSPGDGEEYSLPDFVWSCGNSQVMEYVQQLASENAALKRKSASHDASTAGQAQDELATPVKELKLTAALFDTRDVNADQAMAFLSTVTESDGHQIPPLLTLLKEHASNTQVCAQVCAALENLTFTDTENRGTIVRQGGVEAIVQFMEQHQDSEHVLLRAAVDALWNITFDDAAVDRMAEAPGGHLEPFLAVVQKHMESADLQAGACAVLLNLAVKEQNRWKIVQLGGVALVSSAMQRHSQSEEVLEQGCQALYMLAYHQDLRPLVQEKCGNAASLAASYPHGAGRAQKWGRWLQEVLAC